MSSYLYSVDTDDYPKEEPQPPAGYRFEVWQPAFCSLRPEGTPPYFAVWWLFHHLRVFRNRDFRVFLVKCGNEVAHYSIVSPDYFRFPFMRDDDLTVGDSFTSPHHRRKGLYAFLLTKAATTLRKPERKIWTIHEEGNEGSRKSFLKAGYSLVGKVKRTKRFGIRPLGAYVPE